MPWPKHNKLVAKGVYANTPEQWSISFKFRRDISGDFDITPDDWDRPAITAALTKFWQANWAHPNCHLTEWRGYAQDETNHADPNRIVIEKVDPIVQGTRVSPVMYPLQASLVVGMESTNRVPRAPGKKDPARFGRVYLPGIANTLVDYRMTSDSCTAIANSFKVLVDELRTAMYDVATPDGHLVLVSPFPTGSAGGTINKVDRFRVGRVLDTMTSRRKKLLEEYSVVASGQ